MREARADSDFAALDPEAQTEVVAPQHPTTPICSMVY
jgi:hypothetical protein